MNQLNDSQVMQRIKRALAQYIKQNKKSINTHIIGNIKTQPQSHGGSKNKKETKKSKKKKDSGYRGANSYYARICSVIINKTLKASKCKKDIIKFCVAERKGNCVCCKWTQRYKKKVLQMDFAKAVWKCRHPGYKQEVKSEVEYDDMIGMFRKENELQFIITDNKRVQLAKFRILCRSFQVILTDITPGGNAMRVSYGKEPKIGSHNMDLMMVIKQKDSYIAPWNRMFISGVGYAADLLPTLCFHQEFILNYIIEFFVPPDTDPAPIQLWLQVNDLRLLLDTTARDDSTDTTSSIGGDATFRTHNDADVYSHPEQSTDTTDTIFSVIMPAPSVDTATTISSDNMNTLHSMQPQIAQNCSYDGIPYASCFDASNPIPTLPFHPVSMPLFATSTAVVSMEDYHKRVDNDTETHMFAPDHATTNALFPGAMSDGMMCDNIPCAYSPDPVDDEQFKIQMDHFIAGMVSVEWSDDECYREPPKKKRKLSLD